MGVHEEVFKVTTEGKLTVSARPLPARGYSVAAACHCAPASLSYTTQHKSTHEAKNDLIHRTYMHALRTGIHSMLHRGLFFSRPIRTFPRQLF